MNGQPNIRVLIVDDHPMVCEGLTSMLSTPEVEVVDVAHSGKSALEKIKRLEPNVTLMDIRMPEMSGIDALLAIKKMNLSTRVIMITTYRNISYLLKSLAAGASGFILKDISREELLETVKTVASGARYVDHQFLQGVLRDLDVPDHQQTELNPETIESLTPREMDVLKLIVEGLSNKAIAEVLIISPSTVKGYVKIILEKLYVTDRTQAAVKAIRSGLVQ